jgi:hypothetical protein
MTRHCEGGAQRQNCDDFLHIASPLRPVS